MPSQKKDEIILSAAQRLKGEFGDAFSMEQMAAETGLSRSQLYRKTGGKDALLARIAPESHATGQDVRSRILCAAEGVFSVHGLLGSSLEQIAKDADVGVATLYRHFGDRDGLVRAVVEDLAPRQVVQELLLTPTDNLQDDLLRIVSSVLQAMQQSPGLIRLSLFGSETERAYLSSLRQGTVRGRELIAQYLSAQIAAGHLDASGEPRELALALLGLILSFSLLGPEQDGTPVDDLERSTKLIVNLFLRGVQTEVHHA